MCMYPVPFLYSLNPPLPIPDLFHAQCLSLQIPSSTSQSKSLSLSISLVIFVIDWWMDTYDWETLNSLLNKFETEKDTTKTLALQK